MEMKDVMMAIKIQEMDVMKNVWLKNVEMERFRREKSVMTEILIMTMTVIANVN